MSEETQNKPRKLLIELRVSTEGEITLVGIGDRVKATPIGGPRIFYFQDDPSSTGEDFFTNRVEAIYDEAPANANAFSTFRDPALIHQDPDDTKPPYRISTDVAGSHKRWCTEHHHPVQYFRVERRAIAQILRRSFEGIAQTD